MYYIYGVFRPSLLVESTDSTLSIIAVLQWSLHHLSNQIAGLKWSSYHSSHNNSIGYCIGWFLLGLTKKAELAELYGQVHTVVYLAN